MVGLGISQPAAARSGAHSQPSSDAAPTMQSGIYDAAYFARYAPRTALDIVQHVPGFQLDLGSTQNANGNVDVRGFSGTAGNVVINGARPSSKAETLDATLQRIPAQRVVRVEVKSGEAFGSDYAGKSQVANIILSQQAGIDADVSASASRRYTGYINTDISGSAIIRRGASTINLAAATGRNRQLEEGDDYVTDVLTGEPIEFRRKHNSYFNRDPYLSAAWALERASDKAVRLNVRWQPSTFHLFQSNVVTPSDGPVHDDNLIQRYRDPVLELGGDITRPLSGGAIKLVGLATRRKRNDLDAYIQRAGRIADDALVNGGFEQLVKARRNETIGRLSWTRSDLAGFSFEAGAELAYNTLLSNVDYSETDENGNKVPIPLPGSNASVKEKRGEVYVSAGRTLSPTLRVDGGINYEFSHLTVSGDALADRSLQFLKPNLSLDWRPGGGWHAQASIKRTVAQLDFYDFISVADLSAQRVNGGNADLQPQRTWEFRATAEHPLLRDGLIKLSLGYDLVSMLQDRILILVDKVGLDSPGNLGTGRRAFAELTVDTPLTPLWSGLHLKVDATVQHSSVRDPIDGRWRQWSGFFPDWQWTASLRRDSGRWSYGVDANDNQRTTFYRTDEFDSNFNGRPYATAFVEFRPRPQTALRLDVDNAFETSGERNRLIFIPNRAEPKLIWNEYRERNRHFSIGLTLKQSFGGGAGTPSS
jgi:hypothetical protein